MLLCFDMYRYILNRIDPVFRILKTTIQPFIFSFLQQPDFKIYIYMIISIPSSAIGKALCPRFPFVKEKSDKSNPEVEMGQKRNNMSKISADPPSIQNIKAVYKKILNEMLIKQCTCILPFYSKLSMKDIYHSLVADCCMCVLPICTLSIRLISGYA